MKAVLSAFGRGLDALLSRQEDATALGVARSVYATVLLFVLLGFVCIFLL